MDAGLFANMLSDKNIIDLKKLGYKYPQADLKEFVSLLENGFYKPLPLKDFDGGTLVYLESVAQVHLSAAKVLLTPQNSRQLYGRKAMEDEILSTFTIEQIDTSRDSVRRILSGYAPANESENRIYGMKKGLEFIAILSTKSLRKTSISSMSLPLERFCLRRTASCPVTSTATILCILWEIRWNTLAFPGRCCRSIWGIWRSLSIRSPP